MTQAKHTNGPWDAQQGSLGNRRVSTINSERVIDAKGRIICRLPRENHLPRHQKIANARLIAASPCLLSVLNACIDQMEQCEKMFRDDAEFMEALEDARSAIAKAKGE
jgi:hypothetical protein